MYLIASPTEIEIKKLKSSKRLKENFMFLTAGFGMVESALSLGYFLEKNKVKGAVLFGVCGAYTETEVNILDICLAEKEFFGDLGVAKDEEIEYLTEDTLNLKYEFDLQNELLNKFKATLTDFKIPYKCGNFVTVNASSGTLKRGIFLRNRFSAICENMEGASLARVCEDYQVPLVEIRCVSNLVEDRDKSKWKLKEAIAKGTEALEEILPRVIE